MPSSSSTAALNQLQSKLPAKILSTSPEERYRASMDNLRISRLPEVVIRPENEEQIADLLLVANQYGQPVTTRGAGSATTGSATPLEGGWVLDLSGLKNLMVDAPNQIAYVQPGVTLKALDDEANKAGLTYPPDPGSKAYATIGGTIATNAGGLRGAKYGVTRDYVLALEGFLPTGEFVRWGSQLRKSAVGYNLRDLWIGSEGTLGVITGAVVKLIPRPATRRTILAVFPGEHDALAAVREILSLALNPSVLEILDAQTLDCTHRFWSAREPARLEGLPESIRKAMRSEGAAALLIEVDGEPEESARAIGRISNLLKAGTLAMEEARTESDIENLWFLRRSCSQAMFEWGDMKLNEDVVVPLDSQEELIALTRRIREETGLATPTFGHAADGNFHVHIMYSSLDTESKKKAKEALTRLMEAVIEMGGLISGEHGIGLAKTPFFEAQHGQAELEMMKKIKVAFDPNGILNPDKLWTRFEMWDHPREQVRMPWDH